MEAADLSCKVVNVQDFCSQDINRRIFSAIEFLFWRKGKKKVGLFNYFNRSLRVTWQYLYALKSKALRLSLRQMFVKLNQ